MKMKQFYTYHDAVKYQRYLASKAIKSIIHEAYCWSEQRTVYTVDTNI